MLNQINGLKVVNFFGTMTLGYYALLSVGPSVVHCKQLVIDPKNTCTQEYWTSQDQKNLEPLIFLGLLIIAGGNSMIGLALLHEAVEVKKIKQINFCEIQLI